ncbi:MAG TPA: hypothetical protein VJ623_08735 [Holophagaceae bacterium]|nr:hypothetical protein [Holophagaceae bacterium]HJV90375.1 hypothetical protein [Holophagaceae bacterium]
MNSGYQRHVGLFSAIMLIAGSMIGSGVFSVSPAAIREAGPTQPRLLSLES